MPWRRPLSWAIVAGMLAWLVWRLGEIGWVEVWRALPTSFAFYALVLAAYLVLPVADALIYRRFWGIRVFPSLDMFLRKRVYNSALVGYSGEVALLVWARGRVGKSDAALLHAIKDTNILSAVVSGCGAALLVGWLATRLALDELASGALVWWGVATVALAVLLPLALMARRRTLAMSRREVGTVLAIHALRFLIGLALLLAQWRVVMPDASGLALLTLLAVYVLVGRIPFVPNRDVLFVGIALAVANRLAFEQAPLAGILLATSALQQALHLLVFALAAAVGESPR